MWGLIKECVDSDVSENKNDISDFQQTFLRESPEELPADPLSVFTTLDEIIKSIPKEDVEDLGDNFKAYVGNLTVTVWYEISGQVILGAQFTRTPYGLEVARNPGATDKSVFASELYLKVLQYLKGTIIISSNILSQQGFKVWERLLKQGHTIKCYDYKTLEKFTISTPEELKQYWGKGKDFQKYRYALSENKGINVDSLFSIYIMKKNIGWIK
jgi:hypothetical protein